MSDEVKLATEAKAVLASQIADLNQEIANIQAVAAYGVQRIATLTSIVEAKTTQLDVWDSIIADLEDAAL